MSVLATPIYLNSTMQDHPVLTGQVGTAENLLYKCLVAGFNTQTATSVTRSGNTATFNKANHGFTDYDWVTVAGSDQSEYNGNVQVLPGATTDAFQYAVSGSPATPATGTITAKFMPAGWTRDFNSGQKSIFTADAGSSGCAVRIDHSVSSGQSYRVAFLRGTYGATDVDTLTRPFPLVSQVAAGIPLHVSSTLDSTERHWDFYANGRFFLLNVASNASYPAVFNTVWFGDPISFVPSPAYPALIIGATSDVTTPTNNFAELVGMNSSQTNKYAASDYNGQGDPITVGFTGCNGVSTNLGRTGMASPNPAGSGYSMSDVFVTNGTLIIAKMPGIFHLWHAAPFSNRTLMPEFPDLPGRRIMLLAAGSINQGSAGRTPIDLTGPLYS